MVINDVPIIGWFGAILAVLGLLTYAFKAIRATVRLARKLNDTLDDWQGEPSRPGVPARLGILERLSRVEGQLVTNGGASLKDQTNRIEASLHELRGEFTEHVRASDNHN